MNKYIDLELWFTLEKTYYTLPKTMELWFIKEKTKVHYSTIVNYSTVL